MLDPFFVIMENAQYYLYHGVLLRLWSEYQAEPDFRIYM